MTRLRIQVNVRPLQATTARCACGCWTTGRVCRRSRPTGRSTMRPFTTWPSTPPSPSLPALAQMHLPRSLSDSSDVIRVRRGRGRRSEVKIVFQIGYFGKAFVIVYVRVSDCWANVVNGLFLFLLLESCKSSWAKRDWRLQWRHTNTHRPTHTYTKSCTPLAGCLPQDVTPQTLLMVLWCLSDFFFFY